MGAGSTPTTTKEQLERAGVVKHCYHYLRDLDKDIGTQHFENSPTEQYQIVRCLECGQAFLRLL